MATRNSNSHFSSIPQADIGRSVFYRNHSVKTSFNVGDIVPFYIDDVLPGDTFEIDTNKVIRLQAPVAPVMDNMYLDTYYFFVPMRLVWEHSNEFFGENTATPWTPQTTYTIPQITSPVSTGWNVGTIADYFGIPTGVAGLSVSALPFRAYAMIMNEWFRDENLSDPLSWSDNDSTVAGSNGSNYVTDVAKGGAPYKAAKYHDYFTSCLPEPQKGPDVLLPIGNYAPVFSGAAHSVPSGVTVSGLQFASKDGSQFSPGYYSLNGVSYSAAARNTMNLISGDSDSEPSSHAELYPTNLYTDLSVATGSSINQLRLAFAIQKMYERDARGGTRYVEILKSHFGVTSPDSRLQRPEYLGGNRIPVNINQVLQSSGTVAGQTPLGTTGAYSLTVDHHSDFTRSFTEHGFIVGLMVARYDHTYQNGIERLWSRKTRFDYYDPILANIGEQSVYNKEIFADGSSTDNEVFGYQEAWAEYRYKPSRVTGQMRSAATGSLDVWHLADDYSQLPTLSSSWIMEDTNTVDRVLTVAHNVSNQLFGDIYLKCKAVRPMPLYSIPGLIDHH